jgi:hypothetical protein
MRRLAASLLAASVLAGCGVRASEPPEEEPTFSVPELVPISNDVPDAVRVAIPRLAKDSAERRANRLTV